jgi:hypothetical protein
MSFGLWIGLQKKNEEKEIVNKIKCENIEGSRRY